MRFILTLLLVLTSFAIHAKTYVVCAGIGSYADTKVQTLAKTEKDAKAMAEFYKKGTKKVAIVTGRYATKAQILKTLQSQFGRAQTEGKIVFYFNGHGYPGGFCPYEMKKSEDGLTYEEVIKIMNASKAKDKIIFADACNSGAIRKNQTPSPSNLGNIMMFLSSRGNEYSIESPLLSNGYFTNYLLHGLGGKADSNGDRTITAKELFNYVSTGVTQLSKGKQHPVMWGKFADEMVIVKYGKR